VPKRDIVRCLYPSPPDLAKAALLYSSAELFWILEHGIKMTGMPAWSDQSGHQHRDNAGDAAQCPTR
jgi:hypothetical protein